MARAETIEHVGETGGGGNSPLPGTCRMDTFNPWLTTTTTITTAGSGTGSVNHPSHNHSPQQDFPLQRPAPPLHLEGQDGPRTHQRSSPLSPPSSTPPPSPPRNRREGRRRGTGQLSALSGERSDLDREEHREASRRQGPLPDLLPQNEHHSWASQRHHGATGGEAEQELEVRRLADQLRVIGDEFNTTVLRRAHAGPHWQDIWRGLLNFIDHTLSTLYRLT